MFFIVMLFVLLAVISGVLLNESGEAFIIHTDGCIIRNFSLVSDNIKNLVGPPKRTINCSESLPLLGHNQTHVWLEDEAFSYYNTGEFEDFYCCYCNFSAFESIEDIRYGNCIQFSKIIKADHEFVRVECYSIDSKVHDEYFVFPRIRHALGRKDPTKFNILMFGMESVSRMNFLRTMPTTAKFLHERGSVQLLGYNKLGDNSYPNLFPLLTGRSFKNVLKDCIHNISADRSACTYIWDKFKSKGFATALGSDSPAGLLGTYEYSFRNIPTDYYLQPFMYETRNLFKNKQYYYHMCVSNTYYYKILLNYIYEMSLMENNLFGIFWEESISHEHLNYPHIMDKDYADTLLALENNGYLSESVVIFYSDHGMRWGKIVQTEQGRLEERLPLMEILFPDKFKRLYKLAYDNFIRNSGRLTTAYDVYETLLDLIDPSVLKDIVLLRKYNQTYLNKSSLFLPVSDERTCASVGIEEHWCTCQRGQSLSPGRKMRKLAAQHLISHINNLINKFPQCHNLIVGKILDVSETRDSSGSTFKVVIQASPGDGIFDGTLRMERNLWAVSGTVSRLNLYRSQKKCLQQDQAHMYCYCINNE